MVGPLDLTRPFGAMQAVLDAGPGFAYQGNPLLPPTEFLRDRDDYLYLMFTAFQVQDSFRSVFIRSTSSVP